MPNPRALPQANLKARLRRFLRKVLLRDALLLSSSLMDVENQEGHPSYHEPAPLALKRSAPVFLAELIKVAAR
jgi:hypothetical protein